MGMHACVHECKVCACERESVHECVHVLAIIYAKSNALCSHCAGLCLLRKIQSLVNCAFYFKRWFQHGLDFLCVNYFSREFSLFLV